MTIDVLNKYSVILDPDSVKTIGADAELNRCLSLLNGGKGTIFIPEFNYSFTSPIVLNNYQCLQGIGTPDLVYSGNGTFLTLGAGSKIKSLNLYGKNAANTNGLTVKSGCSCYSVEDVLIRYFDNGIVLSNSYTGTFLNVRSEVNLSCGVKYEGIFMMAQKFIAGRYGNNGKYGFLITGGQHFGHSISSVVEGNGLGGINIVCEVGNFVIDGCYFEVNGPNCIYINDTYKRPTGVIITNNFFNKTPLALKIENGRQYIIEGNTFLCKMPCFYIGPDVKDSFVGCNGVYSWSATSNDIKSRDIKTLKDIKLYNYPSGNSGISGNSGNSGNSGHQFVA